MPTYRPIVIAQRASRCENAVCEAIRTAYKGSHMWGDKQA